MKYIVKKDCLLALPENDKYRGIDGYAINKIELDCNQLVEIIHCVINWQENKYHYTLHIDGDIANNYNTRYYLLDDKTFEDFFRLPVKDCW